MERPLYKKIWTDLSQAKAMVFLSGPRQAGKTTFAKMTATSEFTHHTYFNWDLITDKKKLIENPTFFEEIPRKNASTPLVIFDEIHKYRKWKNYLKGIYDGFAGHYRFLVLGSGRLDLFQKGGDSLAGRYFQFHLWPFTLAELAGERPSFRDFVKNPLEIPDDRPSLPQIWKTLSLFTGFPEPYLSGKETVYRRWSANYHQQLVREDIRNLTEIKDIDHTEILFSLLPSKIGSPLSMASLSRDLQVSFASIRNWIRVFESFYLVFQIAPWTKRISRAITKEKKLYLYDYAGIPSPAAKFENMVGLELLRAVSNWNDLGLGNFKIHYLRNKEKEEVDFLITKEGAPFLLVEAKLADHEPAKSLRKFQTLLKIPAVQLVSLPNVCKLLANGRHQILIASAPRWLASLP